MLPADGGFFEFGDTIRYEVDGHRPRGRRRSTATRSSCSRPSATTSTPTATSSTPAAPAASRCPATRATSAPTSSAPSPRPTPTTGAGGVVRAAPARTPIVLHTKRKEAEFFDSTGRLAGSTSAGDAGVHQRDHRRHRRRRPERRLHRGRRLVRLGPDEPDRDRPDHAAGRHRPTAAPSARSAPARPTARRSRRSTSPTPVAGRPTRTSRPPVTGASTTSAARSTSSRPAGGSNINWIDFVGRRRHRQPPPGPDRDRRRHHRHRPARRSPSTPRRPTPTATPSPTPGPSATAAPPTRRARRAHLRQTPGTYTAEVTVDRRPGRQGSQDVPDQGARRRPRPASPVAPTTSSATRSTPTAGTPSSGPTATLTVADGHLNIPLTAHGHLRLRRHRHAQHRPAAPAGRRLRRSPPR